MQSNAPAGDEANPRRLRNTFPPCDCPTCQSSRAIRRLKEAVTDLDAATDAWCNSDLDDEGRFRFLMAEVEAVIRSPFSIGVRGELRRALKTAQATA